MKTIDGDLLERAMMEMGSSEVGLDADYKPEICDDCAMVFMDLINKAPTLSLNTLRDAIYQDAVAHGLWEGENNVQGWHAECAAVIECEAGELYDAAQEWEDSLVDDPEHFTEELADVVIACLSVAGKLDIDIDAAIRRKMEINKGRPWKHGKE